MAEDDLPLWVVYDHPSDYPDTFVARRHIVRAGEQEPTSQIMEGSLESIRIELSRMGLWRIGRDAADDPVIVEAWL